MSPDVPAQAASTVRFPRLRIVAILWLAIYLPSYAAVHGSWHFLFLCNVGIVLTALGLIFGNALLLSSQALAAPAIALLWLVDAGSRVFTGHFLHGGTAYMWDAQLPAIVRVLSLYHPLWPLLLYLCLRRCGYHRAALPLQAGIATGAVLVGLTLSPASENLNYVIHAPGNTTPYADPWMHAALMLLVLTMLVYWPTHRACRMLFREAGAMPQHRESLA